MARADCTLPVAHLTFLNPRLVYQPLLSDRSLLPEILSFLGLLDTKIASLSYLLVICYFSGFVVPRVPASNNLSALCASSHLIWKAILRDRHNY